MCYVISFRLFEDTDTDLVGDGQCKGNFHLRQFSIFIFKVTTQKEIQFRLIVTAELP